MNGYGVYKWKDGSQYEGNFLNGKKHGKGKYKDINGGYYDGMWKNGKKHGKGILKLAEFEEIINWEWKNGVPLQKK